MKLILSALTAGAFLTGATAAFADEFPAGPGHDTFVRVCSACHSPTQVMGENLDEDGWKNLVETMRGNGAAATDAEAAEIAAYLAKSFPPK